MSAREFNPVAKDDVAMYFACCTERFGELSALFDAIARRIGEHDDLHKLAKLGKDVAADYENVTDCWREEVEKGGVRQ